MVRPLTEGYVVKGGHNAYPSQITERPPAPGAIHPKRTSEVPEDRITGKVKKWVDDRGFGFILADTGAEYFVHRTDLEAPGRCNDEGRLTLAQDERVSFEIVDNPRKADGKKAGRVQVV